MNAKESTSVTVATGQPASVCATALRATAMTSTATRNCRRHRASAARITASGYGLGALAVPPQPAVSDPLDQAGDPVREGLGPARVGPGEPLGLGEHVRAPVCLMDDGPGGRPRVRLRPPEHLTQQRRQRLPP